MTAGRWTPNIATLRRAKRTGVIFRNGDADRQRPGVCIGGGRSPRGLRGQRHADTSRPGRPTASEPRSLAPLRTPLRFVRLRGKPPRWSDLPPVRRRRACRPSTSLTHPEEVGFLFGSQFPPHHLVDPRRAEQAPSARHRHRLQDAISGAAGTGTSRRPVTRLAMHRSCSPEPPSHQGATLIFHKDFVAQI
jgi:hypothetical protein